MSNRESMAYVGTTTCCGAMQAATVDTGQPRPRVAANVAEMIREGLIVARVPSETVRLSFGGGCEVCKPPQQTSLLEVPDAH